MRNPLSHITSHYTRVTGLTCAALALSSSNYTFDVQAFAQSLALDPFIRRFGDCNSKTGKCKLNNAWLSYFNSFIFLTFCIGLWIGTWSQARFGRKKTIMIMNVIPLISTTIMLTSKNRWQLFGGRLFHYVYAGFELGCIPVYQAELMPKEVRGFAVGTYQLSYGLGSLAMNLIIKGTSTLKTDAAWRIPYGLFYVIPTIVGTCSFFIPESPRWLIQQGRVEEARKILRRARVDNTDVAIDAEIEQVQLVVEATKDQGSWLDMVKSTNLRRTSICLAVVFFNQATGQNFNSQYGAVFVKSVGAINTQTMGIINALVTAIATGAAMFATDRIGRRAIFCIGASIQIISLFTMAGLGLAPYSTSVGKGIIAMVPLYGIGYGFGSSSVNHVICAEIPHQSLRDKTQRIAGWVNNLTNFTVAFSLPYALNAPGHLGPKVGFIYGPVAVASLAFGIFFLPECKGRTLEEINLLFYHHVPALKSASWKAEGGDLMDLQHMALQHGDINAQEDWSRKVDVEETEETKPRDSV